MLIWNARGRRVAMAVGTIVYVQDGITPFRVPDRVVRRTPYIVVAWHPREYAAARRDESGRWQNTFMVGGHLATIRSLRTNEHRVVADWLLTLSLDIAGGK